jgi:4-amino-4-deoxy-L-arabinose transferase-like glycosyltransferase
VAVLAVVTLAGLALRVGYAIEQPSRPPPDATAYERIAENLYRHGSFDARPAGAVREVQPASAYSPGLPLLVAAIYELSGGVHLTLALILLAILGAATIPLAFLLGRRFGGPWAGILAAAAIAVYPALLEFHGLLLTEPLAAFLLAAALLAYLHAASPAGMRWAWLSSGALFGLLALVRPEYLVLALLMPLAWLAREALRGRWRAAVAPAALSLLATALVLAPWTIRNEVVLHRFVPVSTGGGKALYIGTYLEADGDGPRLRELLLAERPRLREGFERGGPVDAPERLVLERVLARVAAESYPGLETDAALGRLGRHNLEDDVGEEPLELAGMLARKAFHAWTDAARSVMLDPPWRALQIAILLLAIVGLIALVRRRPFDALACGLVLGCMTAVAALLISSPRRELVVLPLLAALAGAGATACVDSLARWRA